MDEMVGTGMKALDDVAFPPEFKPEERFFSLLEYVFDVLRGIKGARTGEKVTVRQVRPD